MESYIKAISTYLPEDQLTNSELVAEFPEWSVEKVARKVGINTRHIAATGQTATDLAAEAARRLFTDHGVDPASIDFLLLCTQSPDYRLPTSACLLQQRLGLPTTAGALDFNLGCSGYIYGLALAKGLISAGIARNVLLLTAETYSKYIHPTDKGNRSIFGDGAAATLVSTEGMARIGEFVLGTDGSGADSLIVRTGASRCPEPTGRAETDVSGGTRRDDYLYMDGPEIFNFTLQQVPPLVKRTLEANHVSREEVDLAVLHQANKMMLDTLRRACRFSPERFYIDMAETANTVSSTIPIALDSALRQGLIRPGMRVLTAGFGVGFSWAATLLTF